MSPIRDLLQLVRAKRYATMPAAHDGGAAGANELGENGDGSHMRKLQLQPLRKRSLKPISGVVPGNGVHADTSGHAQSQLADLARHLVGAEAVAGRVDRQRLEQPDDHVNLRVDIHAAGHSATV